MKYHQRSFAVSGDDFPVFYKYTVFEGKPVVPLESIILERTLSPLNKRYNINSEVLEFLDKLLLSLGHPSSSCYIFYYFYQYVYFRSTGKMIKLRDLLINHSKVFYKMSNVRSSFK